MEGVSMIATTLPAALPLITPLIAFSLSIITGLVLRLPELVLGR
jgi:hypothetical protein